VEGSTKENVDVMQPEKIDSVFKAVSFATLV
jgi:hypothetical protein